MIADITRCKERFIQIAAANRLAYASVVGTANAGISTWKFNTEITNIMLEADAIIITQAYFQSAQSLRNRFFTQSGLIANGGKLPEFEGIVGKVEFSLEGTNWNPSQEAKTKQDVIGLAQFGQATSYLPADQTAGSHFFEEGYAYHTSPFFRIEYPLFAKTTDLQSLVQHETAVIMKALGIAYKESNVHASEWYDERAEKLMERIRQGAMRLREVPALPERMRGAM